MQQDAKGFILVGFPKNLRMSNMFNRQVKWPEKIVALEVDSEVLFYVLFYSIVIILLYVLLCVYLNCIVAT